MNRSRRAATLLLLPALCILVTGCPPDGVLGTFKLYVINATDDLTVGLVGLDNGNSKALVDVLDENIPADTMKVLQVSTATYGAEDATVQIGIVDVGFVEAVNVQLGPENTVIIVEGNDDTVSARALDFE